MLLLFSHQDPKNDHIQPDRSLLTQENKNDVQRSICTFSLHLSTAKYLHTDRLCSHTTIPYTFQPFPNIIPVTFGAYDVSDRYADTPDDPAANTPSSPPYTDTPLPPYA